MTVVKRKIDIHWEFLQLHGHETTEIRPQDWRPIPPIFLTLRGQCAKSDGSTVIVYEKSIYQTSAPASYLCYPAGRV